MRTPEPPAHTIADVEGTPDGFVIVCACGYVTLVRVEIGPTPPGLSGIAVKCHGCKTEHLMTVTLHARPATSPTGGTAK